MSNNSVVDENPSGSRHARWGEQRSKRRLRRSVGVRLIATAAAAAIAITGLVTPTEPASAATIGRGYTESIGWLTAWSVNGVMTYCLQPTLGDPTGTSVSQGNQQWAGMSANDNARVNFAVTQYGQRANDNWAAATVLYVWSTADPQGYIDHTNGYATNRSEADLYYMDRVPSAQRSTVTSYLSTIRSGASSVTAASTTAGSVTMSLWADLANNYVGELRISNMSPSNATGTVTLTNGVFASTGSNVMSGVRNNMNLDIVGVAPDDTKSYKIYANGVFEGASSSGYAGQVQIFSHSAGQQQTAGPGPQPRTRFTQWAEDPTDRTTTFLPVVGTQVSSKFVGIGEEFSDELTFDTTADADGLNNPWYKNSAGRYIPIIAKGTLYGPSSTPYTESDQAPAGAAIAASGVTVTTTAEDGPTVDYTASSGVTSNASGYYTWVWEIKQSDQPSSNPNVQQFLPDGYAFTDRFGQAVETHVTRFQPSAESKVTEAIVDVGDSITDELTVSASAGTWPTGVDVLFEGTAYAVASDTKPTTSSTVPADAVVIGTSTITADEPGAYTSPAASGTVLADAGYVVWVWKVDKNNQSNNAEALILNDWADDFGITAETSTVRFQPRVTTEVSTKIVKVGEAFADTITFSASQGQWHEGTVITANATLYGPMLHEPEVLTDAPFYARNAGTVTVTTDEPGTKITPDTLVAEETGFYTWVVEIVKSEQAAATQPLIVDGFKDKFGLAPETHVSPSTLDGTSKVSEEEIALSGTVFDTLTVSLGKSGGWLMKDSERITVNFRATAYFVPGETAPAVSGTVPESATMIESFIVPTNKVGAIVTPAITAPDATAGYVSWVWEILDEDQPEDVRGYVAEWNDQFGLVDETTKVVAPEVTTSAQPIGAFFGTATDTATITGTMPATPSTLAFSLYLAPEGAEITEICTADNLVYTNLEDGQIVTATGEYTSPEFPLGGFGTYAWVETLISDKGNVIHEGACGITNELTTVEVPDVTTLAMPLATVVDPIFDTAVVNGSVPDNTVLEFELYKKPTAPEAGDFKYDADGNVTDVAWTQEEVDAQSDEAVCDVSNLVATTSRIAVTAGSNDYVEYVSPDVNVSETGTYWWVERLIVETPSGDVVVLTGECGLATETTEVSDPVVTSNAVGSVELGEEAHDVATVIGPIPGENSGVRAELTFEAFEAVEAVESTDATDSTEPAEVCAVDNRVFNLDEPIIVTAAGDYASSSVVFPKTGTYYWVETLAYVNIATDERTVVHVGECGLPEETTIVTAVPVVPGTLAFTGSSSIATLLVSGSVALLILGIGLSFLAWRNRRRKATTTTTTTAPVGILEA